MSDYLSDGKSPVGMRYEDFHTKPFTLAVLDGETENGDFKCVQDGHIDHDGRVFDAMTHICVRWVRASE